MWEVYWLSGKFSFSSPFPAESSSPAGGRNGSEIILCFHKYQARPARIATPDRIISTGSQGPRLWGSSTGPASVGVTVTVTVGVRVRKVRGVGVPVSPTIPVSVVRTAAVNSLPGGG